jgi:hypothetical protein
MDKLTAVLSALVVLSLGTERLTECIKNLFPKLLVASYSWMWPISWQCKPKVITFRCNTDLIPI